MVQRSCTASGTGYAGPAPAQHAIEAGCDIIGTTLAGYTPARPAIPGPDLEFVREAVALCAAAGGGQLVIGEGRYSAPWQVC